MGKMRQGNKRKNGKCRRKWGGEMEKGRRKMRKNDKGKEEKEGERTDKR